jgi:hypothetical protein
MGKKINGNEKKIVGTEKNCKVKKLIILIAAVSRESSRHLAVTEFLNTIYTGSRIPIRESGNCIASV